MQVEHKPGFFSYRALVEGGHAGYGALSARDLGLPKSEAARAALRAQAHGWLACHPAGQLS